MYRAGHLSSIIIIKHSALPPPMHKEKQKLREAGLDDLEIIELEESPLRRFLKKTYVIGLALFIILLLIVNTNAGYHIMNLVTGKLVSSRFEDYTFTLSSGRTVFFTNETWNALLTLYRTNEQHEFAACLKGSIEEGNYMVDELYVPRTYKQDVYSVTSDICKDSIIALHSHPPLKCLFSEQDIKYYEVLKKESPDAMVALMCSENMISFYPSGN
jgi:proteasome lid subunit RPN8/RPN11